MKVYFLKLEDWHDERVEIGDSLYVGDDYVKITSIVKVDFDDKIIWFVGILEDDLNVTLKKISE